MKKIIYTIAWFFIVLGIIFAGFLIFLKMNPNKGEDLANNLAGEKVVDLKEEAELKAMAKKFKAMPKEEIKKLDIQEKADLGWKLTNKFFLDTDLMIKALDLLVDNIDYQNRIDYRVQALNKLGNYFCDAGRNEEVAEAMYKYEELKPYLEKANGDYSLAGRYIYEDSYNIKTTPFSAAMLSHWYAKQVLAGYDKDKWEEYKKKMQEYMKEFESFAEAGYEPTGIDYYWASMSYAALCKLGEKDSCITYRKVIDQKAQKTLWQALFSAYYYDIVDGDKKKAKEKIEEVIDYFYEFGKPGTPMVVLWNNERKRNVKHDLMYKVIADMMEISPKFKEYIKSVEK